LEMGPHVITRTPMTLARHRDYRTTRRYVRVEGDHLRAAVERLADPGLPPGRGAGRLPPDIGREPRGHRRSVPTLLQYRDSETLGEWRARNMKQASRKQNARVVRPRGSIGSLRFVGMWADRAEMKDSAEWIRIQRAGWIRRSSVVINGT
jgi:hypothetical protein